MADGDKDIFYNVCNDYYYGIWSSLDATKRYALDDDLLNDINEISNYMAGLSQPLNDNQINQIQSVLARLNAAITNQTKVWGKR